MTFKRKPRPVKNNSMAGWLATYSDMMTLIMCFFVMMFAMSSLDREKFAALAESYAGKPTPITTNAGSLLGDANMGLLPEYNSLVASALPDAAELKALEEARLRMEQLNLIASSFRTYLAQNDLARNIMVEVEAEYVRVTFPDGMLFDSGTASLKTGAVSTLAAVGDELTKYPDHFIRVEGHTDSIPMNTAQYPSNRHLSSARADTVVEYLVKEKGLDPRMMSAEGMSEYSPIDTNDTAAGRANNRRVEIKVYAKLEG